MPTAQTIWKGFVRDANRPGYGEYTIYGKGS